MRIHTLCFVAALCAGALLLNAWAKPFTSELNLAAPRPGVPAVPLQFTVADLLKHALDRNGQRWPRPAYEAAVEAITEVAQRRGFPPALILSLIQEESRFQLDAVSPAGALGLTQVLPSTAAVVAEWEGLKPPSRADLFHPGLNIRLGFSFLSYLQDRYGSRETALAVYNGGPEILRLVEGGELPLASYRHAIREGESNYAQWLKSPALLEPARDPSP